MLGIGVGCGSASEELTPDAGVDRGAACEGMCIGKIVLGADAIFLDMAVDRDRRRVYGNGVRSTKPRAMKAARLSKQGPIVVDPSTGRYATTAAPGTGDDTHTLSIFNPDDTLYDSQPLPGSRSPSTSTRRMGYLRDHARR